MKKMNKKGFTIVELVIVIAVIAILAAVMIPTFGGIIETANQSAALQEATAGYKEAYALALANGKIDNDDTYEKAGLTFAFTGTLDAITCTITGDIDGYEFEIDSNGAVVIAEEEEAPVAPQE